MEEKYKGIIFVGALMILTLFAIFISVQTTTVIIEDSSDVVSDVTFDSDGLKIDYTNPDNVKKTVVTPYDRSSSSENPEYSISRIDINRENQWVGKHKLIVTMENGDKNEVIIDIYR